MSLPRRPPRKQSRVAFFVSVLLHVAMGMGLFWLAARQGVLGKRLKEITAVVVPPEEKKPEPKKPEEPKPEVKPAEPAKVEPVKALAPPPVVANVPAPAEAPPAAAPPPSIGADFDFNDGAKAVQATSDPNELFRSVVEFAFRSRWVKPDDIEDSQFVAEVEVQLDPDGRVVSTQWKKGSGDSRWDNSVKAAMSGTRQIGRPPPKGFPERFVVRFDAVADTAPVQ